MQDVNFCLNNLLIPFVMINCMCIGIVVKNSMDFIDNKYIPLIVSIFGIFFNVWFNRWHLTPSIFLEGFVSGLATTGTFELIRNMRLLDE